MKSTEYYKELEVRLVRNVIDLYLLEVKNNRPISQTEIAREVINTIDNFRAKLKKVKAVNNTTRTPITKRLQLLGELGGITDGT